MWTKTNGVAGTAIARGDGPLSTFYTEDAVLLIIDRDNPRSRPRQVIGRSAIDTFWDDICSRAMTHNVEVSILKSGKISQQTVVLR